MRAPLLITMAVVSTLLAGCGKSGTEVTAPLPPTSPTLLKDIAVDRLPSPYYHFEYDATGRVRTVSFASGFTMYDVTYDRGRISLMTNHTLGNNDRLEYHYDGIGRVISVRYVDPNGTLFTTLALSYRSGRLAGIERARKMDSGFVVDKTMAFSYDANGNLFEIAEHRPLIPGFQDDTHTLDRFEQYDDKLNVDSFGLLHDDFFDHLVLLPDVRLQTGNPGRVTRTGDGTNYTEQDTYTYDDRGRPLRKSGDVVITNGQNPGQRFQTLSDYTYY